MPKQKIQSTATEQDKHLSDSFMVVHDQCLQEWVCDEIIVEFDKLPLVEMIEEEGNKFLPVEEQYHDKNHKYESQGRIHGTIQPHTWAFEHIMERVGWALPKGWAFGEISYMQIIKYSEGSHFPWHMDEADSSDTGTCIIMLNDTFIGGQLNVGGHRFLTKTGTIVGFNMSTSTWHNVEPIYKGERYCLAIWFRAPSDEEGELPNNQWE